MNNLAEGEDVGTSRNVLPRDSSPVLTFDFETKNRRAVPFERSLQMILQSIVRQTLAETACLYVCDGRRLTLFSRTGQVKRRIDSAHIELSADSSLWLWNLTKPEEISNVSGDFRVSSFPEVILHGLEHLLVVPLRLEGELIGLLTAGWRQSFFVSSANTLVAGLAAPAAALLARASAAEAASRMLAELTELETDLADLEIADRTGAVLTGSPGSDHTASVVYRHVQQVLDAGDAASSLHEQIRVLRAQVEGRNSR